METSKLNIKSFTIGELAAKLLIIQQDYHNKDILIQGREAFDKFVKDNVQSRFEYDTINPNVEVHLCQHLSLFLLGNENNQFSKMLK